MRASLVWPGFTDYSSLDATWIPHGVCHLATEANKKGHDVEILDGRVYNVETMKGLLKDTASELVGISVLSANGGYAREILEFLKKERPDVKTVIGGIHPTVTEDFSGEAHYLVRGEGEITFPDILDGKTAPGIINGERPDLDKLEYIDRSLIRVEEEPLAGLTRPFATLIIGRGCKYNCTFCQPAERTLFGKEVRMRSVDHVMGEIDSLNLQSFMVHDDCFTADPEYVFEFCDSLPGEYTWWCQGRSDNVCDNMDMVKRMRDAGLRGMIIGFESGDDRTLQDIKKGARVGQNMEAARILQALGVVVWANVMLGLPDESPSAALNTMFMVKAMRPDTVSLCCFTPHPGSYLYDECRDIMPEHDYSYFNRGKWEPKIEGPDYDFLSWVAGEMLKKEA
jgi:radical SAM superfamily enzyme YgiQ (UPF0313 family)